MCPFFIIHCALEFTAAERNTAAVSTKLCERYGHEHKFASYRSNDSNDIAMRITERTYKKQVHFMVSIARKFSSPMSQMTMCYVTLVVMHSYV